MRSLLSCCLLVVVALTAAGYRHVGPSAAARPGVSPEALVHVSSSRDTTAWPATFGFGHTATPQDISALDISVRADGKGLPPGSGSVSAGRALYAVKCAACHGKTGREGPYARLIGPMDDTAVKAKTIGNYWPYATTIFDYTRRAMPYNAPGSLSTNEVYSLTAFLLAANHIIDSNAIVDAQSLPKVDMPARLLFVPDDRRGGPEVR